MTETSLNSSGSVPHSLSSTSSTSQTPAGGRPSDPAKSTSWPVGARSWTGEETAIAHWRASAMLDLPEPLGPTTTAMPWSKQSSTLPGNDLKPRIRSAFRYIGLAFVELAGLRLPERLERLPGRALLRRLLARAGAASELVPTHHRDRRVRALVRRARNAAIDAVDPTVQTVLAGLFPSPELKNTDYTTYLPVLFDVKGIGKAFDIASFHPYARTVKVLKKQIKTMRKLMRKGGVGGKPLWITELAGAPRRRSTTAP